MIRDFMRPVKQRPFEITTIAEYVSRPVRRPGNGLLFRWSVPSDCVLCLGAAHGALLCCACEHLLPWSGPHCPTCALPTHAGEACGACIASPPPYDAAVTAFDYRFPLDRLVLRFKFSADLALGAWLGAAMAGVARTTPRPDLIIASPTSLPRLRERGFNPALVLARSVAGRVGIALEPGAICKVRHTRPQAGLDRTERLRNLRRAFECPRRLDGLHVAVVDDVMTTGSTMAAIAIELRRAGAARVSAWVLARTPVPERS